VLQPNQSSGAAERGPPSLLIRRPSLSRARGGQAWFSFRGRNALVAQRSGFRGKLDETWGASSGEGPLGLLFRAHGSANVRSPQCVQVCPPVLAPI
jgi:hypothetical protein